MAEGGLIMVEVKREVPFYFKLPGFTIFITAFFFSIET